MNLCSTFVSECFCEGIHVSNRKRIADRSRYYAYLWPFVSAFAIEYFRNLLLSVCDAIENSIDRFSGTRYGSMRRACIRASGTVWPELLWWVMPITELAVAIYTISCMAKSNRNLGSK
jgi:hypothetical protein